MRVISAEITGPQMRVVSAETTGSLTLTAHLAGGLSPPACPLLDARCFCENNRFANAHGASRGGTMFPHVPPPVSDGVAAAKIAQKRNRTAKPKREEAALNSASCGWHKALPRGAGLPCTLSLSCGGTRGRSPMASFGTFSTSKRYCPPRHEGQLPHCMGKTTPRLHCRKKEKAPAPSSNPPGTRGKNSSSNCKIQPRCGIL